MGFLAGQPWGGGAAGHEQGLLPVSTVSVLLLSLSLFPIITQLSSGDGMCVEGVEGPLIYLLH